MTQRDPLKDPQPGDWTCDHGASEDDHGQYSLVVDRDGDVVIFIDGWGVKNFLHVDHWIEFSKDDEVLYVAGT